MAGIELYAPRLAKHRRTWTAAAIPLSIVFIILGQVLTVVLAHPLGISLKSTGWHETTFILFSFGFTTLIMFLWAWLFERRSPRELGFNADAAGRYLRGLGLGFGFLAAVVGSIWALGGYTIESRGFWSEPSLLLLLPFVCLLAGFMVQGATEEIIMRGWLLQLVTSRHGIYWGIAVNMLIFSLLHAGNIKPSPELAVGLLNIVLVAILLSLYAIKEGSLWGVCAWHSAWNWLLGVGFGLEVSGEKIDVAPIIVDLTDKAGAQWWLTGAKFGPEASVVTSVILLLGIAYFVAKGALKPGAGYSVPVLPAKEAA